MAYSQINLWSPGFSSKVSWLTRTNQWSIGYKWHIKVQRPLFTFRCHLQSCDHWLVVVAVPQKKGVSHESPQENAAAGVFEGSASLHEPKGSQNTGAVMYAHPCIGQIGCGVVFQTWHKFSIFFLIFFSSFFSHFSLISSLFLFSFSFIFLYPLIYPQILLKNQNLQQNSP